MAAAVQRHTVTQPLNSRCGVQVSTLGLGCASMGELFHAVSDEEALQTVRRSVDIGITYFDTAPWYGIGLSEIRLGLGLRGPPPSMMRDPALGISTKVGRYLRPLPDPPAGWDRRGWAGGSPNDVLFGYSRKDIERQHEDSLQRMGCGRVDCLVIHDMEQAEAEAGQPQVGPTGNRAALADSGFVALCDLRQSGRIRAFGAGINSAEGRKEAEYRAWNLEYARFLTGLGAGRGAAQGGGIDFFLLAGTHTLLNHSAWQDGVLKLCEEHDVGVVLGGAFNSGILATGARPGAKYDYSDASDDILDRVRRIEQVCKEHDVALASAALQFPLGHPRVRTVIAGCSDVSKIDRAARNMNDAVPDKLWGRLKDEGLLPDGMPTPTAAATGGEAKRQRNS